MTGPQVLTHFTGAAYAVPVVVAATGLSGAYADAQYPTDHHALETAAGNATTHTNATTATSSTAHSIPFATMENADDTLVHILGFLVILAAAHPLGLLFPRLARLPLITGYLLVGIVTGPFVTNLVTTDTVNLLSKSVNTMALSFISFQAGQEIYLPELKPQIKDILKLLFMLYFTAMLLLTLVLWLGASPFFYGAFDSSCKLAIALLFGSIAVLGSPATVMAIKIELDSNGPFTNLMLGATMTAEFVVLVSFSISRVIASVYCAKLDVSVANLLFTLGVVFSNLLVGSVIGVFTIAVFLIPGGPHHGDATTGRDETAVLGATAVHPNTRRSHDSASLSAFFGSLYFKGFIWLFVGYVFYIGTNTISEATIAKYGHSWDVKFEPLLVLMTASCIAGHYASIRHDMHVILDSAAPYMFLPFFVMTGAALKLDQVADAIPLMSLYVILRYVAIFVACYCGGRFVLKLTPKQYNNLWLTMTPQAGVALGLANEIKGLSSDPWAAEFAATIVAAVVVNQIIGPVLCSMGLSRAGESRTAKQQGGHDTNDDDIESELGVLSLSHSRSVLPNPNLLHVSSAIVVGTDDAACEIAMQLALHGALVKIPLLSDERAARWQTLLVAIQSSNSSARNGGGRRNQQLSNNFIELQHIIKSSDAKTQHSGGDDQESTVRLTLAVATAPGSTTETVFFTGDARRTLEHVKLLAASATDKSKMPRLVALVQDLEAIDELRKLNVLIVQPSLALANIATRIGLSDASQARLLCADSCPPDATSSAALLLEPAAGGSASVQHVMRDRRLLLQRNVRRIATGSLHLVPHDALREALGLGQLPPSSMAPNRVSMFGRSSAAQGPEYFLASSGVRAYRPSNVDSRGDVYVMGDEPSSPADDYGLDASSTRSAKSSYIGPNATPRKSTRRR